MNKYKIGDRLLVTLPDEPGWFYVVVTSVDESEKHPDPSHHQWDYEVRDGDPPPTTDRWYIQESQVIRKIENLTPMGQEITK